MTHQNRSRNDDGNDDDDDDAQENLLMNSEETKFQTFHFAFETASPGLFYL